MVDIYSSLSHGIAKRLSTIDYNTDEWKCFYKSLVFLYEMEHMLYEKDVQDTSNENQKKMEEVMLNNIDTVEGKVD